MRASRSRDNRRASAAPESRAGRPRRRRGFRRAAARSRTRSRNPGQQRVGIGADRVEGDVAEIEQSREADHDVQAPAEHDVDQDLDAEIVDPFHRAAEAARARTRHRIEEGRSRARTAMNKFGEMRAPGGGLQARAGGARGGAAVPTKALITSERSRLTATTQRDHDREQKRPRSRATSSLRMV